MPSSSYLISGNVDDTDGSTNLADVKVTCYNSNTNEWMPAAGQTDTNASGDYILDLVNMTNQWTTGDVVYVLFLVYKNGRVVKSAEYRHTLLIAGVSTRAATMKWGNVCFRGARVRKLVATNRATAVRRIDWYDRRNDTVYIEQNIVASSGYGIDLGERGVYFEEGLAKIMSSDTANETNGVVVVDGEK